MKAIFLLRNPVSRAYSHYQHEVRRGRETRTFEQCIEDEIRQESDASESDHEALPLPRRTYLARGVYVNQLTNWRSHFPAEQMLVLQAERMFKHPREVFAEVLDFLSLEPWVPREFGNLNPGRYSTPVSAAARQRAAAYFTPRNEKLFDFLGERYEWQ